MYGFYFCAVNNKVNYLGLKEKLEKLSKLITTSMTQIGKDLKGGTLKWSGYKILFLKFVYFIYVRLEIVIHKRFQQQKTLRNGISND